MGLPIHYIHVYKRPKQSAVDVANGIYTNLLQRHSTYNYQHTITNQGWFDTASCDIGVRSLGEGLNILETYVGCYVAIYVDNPAQPIWEGLINRVTFNSGSASYTQSLDDMANRISVVYTGAANAAAQTSLVNDTVSQGIFGIKQDQMEFGVDPSAAGTARTTLQNTELVQRAYPQTSVSQAQGQSNLVHLELIGIFHTLEWVKSFTTTATTTTAAGTIAASIIAANPNGTTFFDSDTSLINANPATVPDQQRGVSFWDRLQKIAELGDGTNYWICGINPTNRNTGKRVFYYRQFNGAINYVCYQADGLKPRNQFGQPIPPYLVVPDQAIRVNDILVGHDTTLLTDPRATYIQSVQYDANTQQVQWFGADNTTARAAFQLNKGFKALSKNMPGTAPLRTIAT